MRARGPLVGMVAMSTVVIAGPAWAKVDIAKATISGPGLGDGIRIEAPDVGGLWGSGIDLAGGLDDARADSVEELGLTPADLGPRYLVTYLFFRDDRIRQILYPYAETGPVTYTPSAQRVAVGQPWGGRFAAGWYQGSPGFFHYLVARGLPERIPLAQGTAAGTATDTAKGQAAPWAGIAVALVGLTALSSATLAVLGWARSGPG